MVSKNFHLTNMSKTFVIFFILTACILPVLYAQDENSVDYYVERRFIQRLSWNGNEYVSRYEIVIEKNERGLFQQVYQDFSTELSVEVSLPPGLYRYRVIPYDFIGRRGRIPEWIDFEIFAAVYPKLIFSVPELYLTGDEKPVFVKEYVLFLYGEDISPHSDIFIRRENGSIIKPVNVNVAGNRTEARLVFPDYNSIPRNFDVVVRNPGDLEGSIKTRSYISSPPDKAEARRIFDELEIMPESLKIFFGIIVIAEPEEEEIEKEPPVPKFRTINWFIGITYAPLFSTYENLIFLPEATMSVISAEAKFGFVHTPKDKFLGIGMDTVISFFMFDSVSQIRAVTMDANFIVQKLTFNEKMGFRIRLGIGIDILSGDEDVLNVINFFPFHVNFGGTFVWFAAKHFYMETGVNMVCFIQGKETSGAVRPFFGFGTRF